MSEMRFKIVEEIAVIKLGGNLWRKELNLISWNEQEPRYDIRWWPDDRSMAGKGITLTQEELYSLGEAILLLFDYTKGG